MSTTLRGMSSVCAKLEPASSKNNEIPEINVLQKFASHAPLVRQTTVLTYPNKSLIQNEVL